MKTVLEGKKSDSETKKNLRIAVSSSSLLRGVEGFLLELEARRKSAPDGMGERAMSSAAVVQHGTNLEMVLSISLARREYASS